MKNLAFFFFAMTFLLFSCNEDSVSGIQENDSSDITVRGKDGDGDREVRPPFVDKDILVFDDSEQFFTFYEYLDAVYEQGEDAYDTQVEAILGDFPSVKHRLDNDAFTDFADAYKPFLTDPIMATLLNENFEVVIEDMYIVQMNNEQVVQMDITNTTGRAIVQGMTKGHPVDGTLLPEEVYVGKDTDKEIFTRNIICNCSVEMELVDCNTIEISGKCRNFWKSTDGVITVSILNGVTTTTNVHGPYSFTVDVSGFPFGLVTLNVNGNPDCALGSDTNKSQNFSVGAYCDTDENDTGWNWKENSGQAISYRTATYKSYWRVYEEARVYSYAWSPSGWTKNKSELSATIDAFRKNNLCGTINSEDETKDCGNCNYKRARVNWYAPSATQFVAYCTGDVVGTYSKTKSGISVSDTDIIEYDCCM